MGALRIETAPDGVATVLYDVPGEQMNTLRDWHGDIEEFIDAKQKEEKKAWALIEQGYDGSYNGDAYGSVMYQNENLSVRASDDFMQAVAEDREEVDERRRDRNDDHERERLGVRKVHALPRRQDHDSNDREDEEISGQREQPRWMGHRRMFR